MFLIGNISTYALSQSNPDLSSRAGISSYAEYSIVCNLLVIAGTVLFMMVVKGLVTAMGSTAKA